MGKKIDGVTETAAGQQAGDIHAQQFRITTMKFEHPAPKYCTIDVHPDSRDTTQGSASSNSAYPVCKEDMRKSDPNPTYLPVNGCP